jgi:hypothetical protein
MWITGKTVTAHTILNFLQKNLYKSYEDRVIASVAWRSVAIPLLNISGYSNGIASLTARNDSVFEMRLLRSARLFYMFS